MDERSEDDTNKLQRGSSTHREMDVSGGSLCSAVDRKGCLIPTNLLAVINLFLFLFSALKETNEKIKTSTFTFCRVPLSGAKAYYRTELYHTPQQYFDAIHKTTEDDLIIQNKELAPEFKSSLKSCKLKIK